MTKKNVLSRKQMLQVAGWLQAMAVPVEGADQERINEHQSELASKASEGLGFEVNANNIKGLAEDLDIELAGKRRKGGGSTREHRVDNNMRSLARAVLKIAHESGVKLDPKNERNLCSIAQLQLSGLDDA